MSPKHSENEGRVGGGNQAGSVCGDVDKMGGRVNDPRSQREVLGGGNPCEVGWGSGSVLSPNRQVSACSKYFLLGSINSHWIKSLEMHLVRLESVRAVRVEARA